MTCSLVSDLLLAVTADSAERDAPVIKDKHLLKTKSEYSGTPI